MSATYQHISGACMCGAVEVQVTPGRDDLSTCHCDMCRRWTSTSFTTIQAQDVAMNGPVKTIKTSSWAERGFCTECGSVLFYRFTAEGPLQGQHQMSAGLFPNAGGRDLKLELFIDRKPDGYGFAGAQRRMTEADAIAAFDALQQGDHQ